MRVFKEYLLDEKILSIQTLYLPSSAEVVNILKTTAGLKLLVIVKHASYEQEPLELHKYQICVNDEIFYTNTVKYIGSFESDVGVKHVIEVD
jgi:hypothetical protein